VRLPSASLLFPPKASSPLRTNSQEPLSAQTAEGGDTCAVTAKERKTRERTCDRGTETRREERRREKSAPLRIARVDWIRAKAPFVAKYASVWRTEAFGRKEPSMMSRM
jgi:hypothetical protein